jgi:prepilin-type N-terminal cleavage/methylation domain-containing protein
MQTPMVSMRRGFTFLEIIVVIGIISLIYSLGFSALKFDKPKPKPLSPLNLKENIAKAGFSNGATFMCVENCKKCFLRKGIGEKFSPYANKIDLTGTIAYRLNKNNSLEEIEYGKYDDQRICLVLEFYKNGSSTQMVLQNKKGIFFIPSYFGTAQKFQSLDEAQTYWVEENEPISDSGAYY